MLCQNCDGLSNGILTEVRDKTHLRQNSVIIFHQNSWHWEGSWSQYRSVWRLSPKIVTDPVKICDGLRHNTPVTSAQIPYSCALDLHIRDGIVRRNFCHNFRHNPNVPIAISVTIIFWPSSFPSQIIVRVVSVTNNPSQLRQTYHNEICDQWNFDGRISVIISVTITWHVQHKLFS